MPRLVPAGVRAAQPLDTWCLPIGRSLVVTALDAHDLPLGFVFSIRDPSAVLVVLPTHVNVTTDHQRGEDHRTRLPSRMPSYGFVACRGFQ